jgi:SAM-dependent methyltransferase
VSEPKSYGEASPDPIILRTAKPFANLDLKLPTRVADSTERVNAPRGRGSGTALYAYTVSVRDALYFGGIAASSRHPVFARVWARAAGWVADDARRAELVAGLGGRVVEIGCGDGRAFRHYPAAVAEVVAVEPEPYLRGLAQRAALGAPVPVSVIDGSARALPFAAASCDAVVVSLVLCSVGDQTQALGEIVRIMRAGAELRFLEHVVADHRLAAAVQSGLDRSGIWPRLAGGCHLGRDTVGAIAASGLEIERLRRFHLGPQSTGLPCVLGSARRTRAC